MIAPEPVRCPLSHAVALEHGKCCCKEDIVASQILAPSVTTPCNECDDGMTDDFDSPDKINCFANLTSEYCVNHGNTDFYFQ